MVGILAGQRDVSVTNLCAYIMHLVIYVSIHIRLPMNSIELSILKYMIIAFGVYLYYRNFIIMWHQCFTLSRTLSSLLPTTYQVLFFFLFYSFLFIHWIRLPHSICNLYSVFMFQFTTLLRFVVNMLIVFILSSSPYEIITEFFFFIILFYTNKKYFIQAEEFKCKENKSNHQRIFISWMLSFVVLNISNHLTMMHL